MTTARMDIRQSWPVFQLKHDLAEALARCRKRGTSGQPVDQFSEAYKNDDRPKSLIGTRLAEWHQPCP
jgi:hypothetical protein